MRRNGSNRRADGARNQDGLLGVAFDHPMRIFFQELELRLGGCERFLYMLACHFDLTLIDFWFHEKSPALFA